MSQLVVVSFLDYIHNVTTSRSIVSGLYIHNVTTSLSIVSRLYIHNVTTSRSIVSRTNFIEILLRPIKMQDE
jgi:hypothetical protein